MERIFEWFSLLIGGVVGWFVGKFEPAFPLIIIATLFVLYDAWSAYELDKRVHIMYPKKKRIKAKFVSYKFRQVIPTLIERFVIIILAYCVERWVFVHVSLPLSYIVTGVILFEQAWSALENNSSCRSDEDSRFWRMLQRFMVDKTARHFDHDFEKDMVTEEQIERIRERLREWDEMKGHKRTGNTIRKE
jgi:hypothetical protein